MNEIRRARLRGSSVSAVAQFKGHENSVGFLPIKTCPGATKGTGGCTDVCYARHGRSRMPTVKQQLERNTRILLAHCEQENERELTSDLLRLIDRAAEQFRRRKTIEAEVRTPLFRQLHTRGSLFRFQWAGDLVDATHARAIRATCEKRPDTTCWLYTRSFHLLEHLGPPPSNLVVWLSMDEVNEAQARSTNHRYRWTKIARMQTEPIGLVCPKYTGLPTEQACARCGICYHSTATSITFPIKHATTATAAA
jgi:hypothetical protein